MPSFNSPPSPPTPSCAAALALPHPHSPPPPPLAATALHLLLFLYTTGKKATSRQWGIVVQARKEQVRKGRPFVVPLTQRQQQQRTAVAAAAVAAGLPRGVAIIWKSKSVDGKLLRHHSNGIAKKGYSAQCGKTKCKKHNPMGEGKEWRLNFDTIEAAAEAYEKHSRDPFDLDNKDIMHWS